MRVIFHRAFKKQYKKLPAKIQVQFQNRLKLYLTQPNAQILNVHPLSGEMSHYMSMNVSGDFRALFVQQADEIIFEKIGTHSQLYL